MLTVVTGPPCSGKSTYVREHSAPGDVAIDFDLMAQALGSPHDHDHPKCVIDATQSAWWAAVKWAITNHCGINVWLIDSFPSDWRQEQYTRTGAKLIRMRADMDEIADRMAEREKVAD